MLELLSAGASLIGNMFSSHQSGQNVQEQIAASQQQQATQNAFTERMSNTAYQRATSDMEKAGLNPMMMFGSGSAASTPAGSSIQAPMPQKTSAFGNLGDVVSKALDNQVKQQSMDKMVQEISNLQTQSALTEAQRKSEEKRPALIEAETGLESAKTKSEKQGIVIRQPQVTEATGVSGMGDSVVQNTGKVKYLAGAAGDVVAPVLNSATKVLSLDVLKNALKPNGIRIRPGSVLDRAGSGE